MCSSPPPTLSFALLLLQLPVSFFFYAHWTPSSFPPPPSCHVTSCPCCRSVEVAARRPSHAVATIIITIIGAISQMSGAKIEFCLFPSGWLTDKFIFYSLRSSPKEAVELPLRNHGQCRLRSVAGWWRGSMSPFCHSVLNREEAACHTARPGCQTAHWQSRVILS